MRLLDEVGSVFPRFPGFRGLYDIATWTGIASDDLTNLHFLVIIMTQGSWKFSIFPRFLSPSDFPRYFAFSCRSVKILGS